MSKNPLLKQKYKQGYENGYKNGIAAGRESAVYFFASKLEKLHESKGIGDATMNKIVDVLGREYFKDVEK